VSEKIVPNLLEDKYLMNCHKIENKIREEKFTSAKAFIDALDLSSSRWLPDPSWNSRWVFRGQRKADWHLTPKAWRDESSPVLRRLNALKNREYNLKRIFVEEDLKLVDSRVQENTSVEKLLGAYSQAKAELLLVSEFLNFADQLGHPVPDADKYNDFLSEDIVQRIRYYPKLEFLPEPNSTTALAQHHGIPTRAIDWTYNPLIAAFFAAEKVTRDTEGNISVWAIRYDLLNQYNIDSIQEKEYSQFLSFTTTRSENTYLHAQEGLFIFPKYGCSYYAINGCWPTLEEYAIFISGIAREDVIQKLTLPYAHVGELLRLLWARGITRGHLMPTYDNVTKSLIAKWSWWDY